MILHLSPPFLQHLSPGCPGALGRMSLRLSPVLHLSPSCLPLPGSALDRLSPSWLPGSPLSKKGVDALDLLILDYLPLVSQCAVGALGRMTRAAGALGPMMLHLPPTCVPVCCGCSEVHGSTLVPHLSPTCPALVSDCPAVCFGFSGPP